MRYFPTQSSNGYNGMDPVQVSESAGAAEYYLQGA